MTGAVLACARKMIMLSVVKTAVFPALGSASLFGQPVVGWSPVGVYLWCSVRLFSASAARHLVHSRRW